MTTGHTAEHPHGGDWRTRGTGASSYFERDATSIARSRAHGNGHGSSEGLADGLGWISLALGAAATVAPARVAHMIGLRADRDTCDVIRAVGFREIASGAGILAKTRPTGWVWARVGGDVMDLALLGSAFGRNDANTGRVAMAAGAVAGIAAVDVLCAQRLTNQRPMAMRAAQQTQPHREVTVYHALTINKPASELYAFWRDFTNLPRFMQHLESVEIIDQRRSRWRAKAPAGMKVEWEAEVTEDTPNERIAWRSLEGADVANHGSVNFMPSPGGRGTEVRVHLEYVPPAGQLGRWVAKLFGEEPDQQVKEDLRRFKQLMETGEIPYSDASYTGGPARPPRRGRERPSHMGAR